MTCSSLEETCALARALAPLLQEGDIVFLNGELGAGKTTFVQAIAKEMGIQEAITSPTFNLMLHYSIPLAKKPNPTEAIGDIEAHITTEASATHVIPSQELRASTPRELFHFDLYRIKDPAELGETGLLDVAGAEGVTFIEWGAPFQDMLGDSWLQIDIERTGNTRTFTISASDTDKRLNEDLIQALPKATRNLVVNGFGKTC